jgi:hypothetical protein
MIDKYFTQNITVKRLGWSTDEDGYDYSGEITSGTFKGHLQQASPELINNLGDIFTVSHIVWCPVGTDVKRGDTLEIGDRSFGVSGIQENTYVGNNRHLEVLINEYVGS